MTLTAQSERRRAKGPLAVSLCLHGAAFFALVHAPAIELPHASESEYRQAIAGREEKLVWYKFKDLPPLTPPRRKADPRPLRAKTKATQAMVSSAKNAPSRNQMVWTPAPELAAAALESPNLIAVKLPDPAPKAFTAPPDLVRPAAAEPELAPEAPKIEANATPATPLLPAKLPPKAYVPPPAKTPAVAKLNPLEDAPQIAVVLPSAQRKPFLPPPPAARAAEAPAKRLAEAPQLAAALPAGPELRKVFLPPPPPKTPVARVTPADAPPDDLNVAIVGTNPVEKMTVLPAAPSPASFSAGPVVRKNGAVSAPGPPGVVVPDLFVRAPRERPRDTKSELLAQAYAAPTSAETLRAAIRRGEPVTVPPAPENGAEKSEPSGAARVSSAPDARFTGREVFMMAIQMPNLTSFSGSWLMWYSDRTGREAGLAPIAPPVAHRKVDPKYIATAVEERVEGNVRLFCEIDSEGNVSKVELVRGLDDRLNQSAAEALAKWEFYPATRHGVPLDVDVLVEIPFRLAPKPQRR